MTTVPFILLPAAGSDEYAASFYKYGLLAERTPEGISCNLRIIGGLGGITIEPQWGTRCTSGFLLAVSIVRQLTEFPSEATAPLAPYLTANYGTLIRATHMLDDGTCVTSWQTGLANRLADEYIYAAPDPNSLSLPMEVLLAALAKYVHQMWPDDGDLRLDDA